MYDEIILFLASFLVWIMFAGLFVLWFTDGKIKKEQVLHALLASFIAWALAEILKQVFHTPRPYDLNHLATFTATLPTDPGFPSGHAAMAFGLAVTIWLHDRKIGVLFIVMAALVAWGRVLANVHYPIDVVGGALIGITVAYIVERFHYKLRS